MSYFVRLFDSMSLRSLSAKAKAQTIAAPRMAPPMNEKERSTSVSVDSFGMSASILRLVLSVVKGAAA